MTTTISITDNLAVEINQEHHAATTAVASALQHARRCGELLLQAKAEIGHGHFLSWVAEHCDVGERQARNYMRITQHWDTISNRQRASDLSVRQALALTHDGTNDTEGLTWLTRELADAEREMRELVDVQPGKPGFKAWLNENITLANVKSIGMSRLQEQAILDTFTRASRIRELGAFIDAVVDAANQRVIELEGSS